MLTIMQKKDTKNKYKFGLNAKWQRIFALIFIYALLLTVGYFGSEWAYSFIKNEIAPNTQSILYISVVLFALLLAIPFVPSLEVSLGLLMLFGKDAAIPLYTATIIALCITFAVGRLIDANILSNLLGYLNLSKAQKFVLNIAQLNRNERLELMLNLAPKKYIPLLLKHRYIAIGLAINMPGNTLIGGGGGIALLAGMVGIFTWPLYLLTVMIAVAPIPITVFLMAP